MPSPVLSQLLGNFFYPCLLLDSPWPVLGAHYVSRTVAASWSSAQEHLTRVSGQGGHPANPTSSPWHFRVGVSTPGWGQGAPCRDMSPALPRCLHSARQALSHGRPRSRQPRRPAESPADPSPASGSAQGSSCEPFGSGTHTDTLIPG